MISLYRYGLGHVNIEVDLRSTNIASIKGNTIVNSPHGVNANWNRKLIHRHFLDFKNYAMTDDCFVLTSL